MEYIYSKKYMEVPILDDIVNFTIDKCLLWEDKDFSELTSNCLQVDLQKTFKDGFKIGNSYIREPQSIRSAASLACIVLQSSQNDMFKPKG